MIWSLSHQEAAAQLVHANPLAHHYRLDGEGFVIEVMSLNLSLTL